MRNAFHSALPTRDGAHSDVKVPTSSVVSGSGMAIPADLHAAWEGMIHVNRSDSNASHSRVTARRDLPDVILVPARRSRSGQPDFSATDESTASPSERLPPQAWDRRRLRRLVEPGFLVIVGAVVLIAAQLTTSRNDPD